MTQQQEQELEQLNEKITKLLDALGKAKNIEAYDSIYDALITAHDRREVLFAHRELDAMEETYA